MEFDWSEEERSFRTALRAFLKDALPKNWDQLSKDGPGSDAQAAFSRTFCAELARRGWLTPHWPTEYGGAGASAWQHAVLSEEMWACGEPRGPQYMNVNWVGPTLMRYGSAEQKREHLSRISKGDVLWCQGFSEPNAGSDLASLTTRADRRGDVYVVNGQKVWTSYCKNADFCFLLVRTDPTERRHRGVSLLLMPMSLTGVEVREINAVIGERYFHEVFLTDVEVPASCLLGPEHGGWEVAMYALQYERVGLPRYARSMVTLDQLAVDARARGRLSDPSLVEALGAARALCAAARLLYYRVIDQRARGVPPTADSNVARIALIAADRAVGDLALQIWGAEALVYGSPGDSCLRNAMPAGIATGAAEIHLNLVAERFLGLPREK
jgi:alkylation response protein AidB-like acyl-CoA dehydrogenase